MANEAFVFNVTRVIREQPMGIIAMRIKLPAVYISTALLMYFVLAVPLYLHAECSRLPTLYL